MHVPPRLRRQTVIVGVLLLASGCGQPGSGGIQACTEIGAEDGVSVTVAQQRASSVDNIDIEVCFEGRCTRPELLLHPGSTTVDQGCNSKDVCSATSIPNGTLVGFAPVPNLPEGMVEVRATITSSTGETETPQVISAPTETVYPNGPQCPGEGQQLALTLDESGLHPS